MSKAIVRPRGLIVDAFAGAGGASLGIRKALGRSPDIAIDMDPVALQTHALHHPETRHVCMDIQKVRPRELTKRRPVALLWASPACTMFSQARGAGPKCDDSRNLAWSVVRWAREVRPTVIICEQVRQFLAWGPLDAKGRPDINRKGETFAEFVEALAVLGYDVDWRLLNSAEYGVPQTRKRLFLVARNDNRPICWPRATHGPGTWKTVRRLIDWRAPMWRISKEKPLKAISRRRIALGVEKFKGQPFLVQLNHGESMGNGERQFRGQSLDEPARTITSHNSLYLCVPDELDVSLRFLSVGEFARFQGFPKGMKFCGSMVEQRRQVGMAVPPGMARRVVGVNV